MKAVALYLSAALVTGLHNFYWLMAVVNGAPINVANCVGLPGSAMLLAAALLVQSRPRTAAKLALVGSLLLWVFYAPLIIVSLSMPWSTRFQFRDFMSFRDYVPIVGTLLGPILLVACTVNSALFLRRHRVSGAAMQQ